MSTTAVIPIKDSDRDNLNLKNNQIHKENKIATEALNPSDTKNKNENIQNSILNNQVQPQINNMSNANLNVPNSIPVVNLSTLGPSIGREHGFVPIINPKEFGSKPISTYCPSCRFPITTTSSRKLNCCSCLFCCCCIELWICLQCYRKKEITCWDYEHKCPRCGFIIGNYDAW